MHRANQRTKHGKRKRNQEQTKLWTHVKRHTPHSTTNHITGTGTFIWLKDPITLYEMHRANKKDEAWKTQKEPRTDRGLDSHNLTYLTNITHHPDRAVAEKGADFKKSPFLRKRPIQRADFQKKPFLEILSIVPISKEPIPPISRSPFLRNRPVHNICSKKPFLRKRPIQRADFKKNRSLKTCP